MTKVVCALRSGGEFEIKHVARLRDQLRGNVPAGTPIICISDQPHTLEGVEFRHVPDLWPGYWCKMAIYRLPGPALYLDLDVTVTGDLRPFLGAAACHAMIMNRDFWGMQPPYINAAVMGWAGDVTWIYEKFAKKADHWMDIWRIKGPKWQEIRRHSDQGLLVDWLGLENIARWQWELPGMLYSFKREIRPGLADMSDCRLVVSHGQPRPWSPDGADRWLESQSVGTSCTRMSTS